MLKIMIVDDEIMSVKTLTVMIEKYIDTPHITCLLYTSDAADERSSVDLGGRRIIKKKKENEKEERDHNENKTDETEMR